MYIYTVLDDSNAVHAVHVVPMVNCLLFLDKIGVRPRQTCIRGVCAGGSGEPSELHRKMIPAAVQGRGNNPAGKDPQILALYTHGQQFRFSKRGIF